jgi:hypothetical protein
MPYLAYRRRSGLGAHQFAGPSSRITAGTSSTRTIVTSTTSATIIPAPSSLMNVTPEAENAPTTMTSSRARLVISPPVRCSPMAESDSTFITIALTGSTTDPNARNSSTNVASATTSAIHGRTLPRLDSSSTSCALCPPT